MTTEPTPTAPKVHQAIGEILEGAPGARTQENLAEVVQNVRTLRNEAVRENKCIDPPIGCGRIVSPEEVDTWGPLTKKEAGISGLCGPCQVEVMGGSVND